LRLVTDNIGLPMGYIDRGYVFRYSNRPGLDRLGIDEDQMLGRHLRDIFGADVFAEVKPHLDRALGGEKTTFERLARYGSREPAWVRTTLLPDRQPDGQVAGVYSVVEDIDQ